MLLENSSFTIYEVEELKGIFEELLGESEIILDFTNISKIDMSAIQLLISLKQTCEKQNKKFEIKNINDDVLDSLNLSGTAFILGV